MTDSSNGVVIDYGPGTRRRIRTSLNGDRRFIWDNGGGEIVPYGARLGVLERARDVGVLILVEGESDSWALGLADYPALGLPGAAMAGLLGHDHLEGIARLFVVQEPDEAGARFVAKVTARVRTVFTDSTPPPLSVITMEEGIKDPAALLVGCADVNEFRERLNTRLDVAVPVDWDTVEEDEPESRRLEVRPVAASTANPPPPLDPLVTGLILPGDKVVIGGARGAAKSWLAMGLGIQMARGEGDVLGRFPVARPAKVLHAHGELLDDSSTVARWEKLADTDLPVELLETFERWRIRPVKRRETYRDEVGTYQTEWFDAEIDRRVGPTLEDWRPDVLIVDPWRTFFVGDENSNTEVEAALSELDALADQYGLTIIITHHFSQYRQGADPEDWWRGASRLADWASVRITLGPAYDKKQAKDQNMTRMQARQYARVQLLLRRLPTPEDFGARWNPATGWWESWKLPGEDTHTKLSPEQVLEELGKAGGNWSSLRDGAKQLGTTATTLTHVLERLAAEGRVEEVKGPRGARGWKLTKGER